MELCKPYLFQEDFDITWREIVDLLRDFLDGDTFITSSLISERNNRVYEFSEVITDWKIDKNILEKTDKVFTCKAAYTLKALKFA